MSPVASVRALAAHARKIARSASEQRLRVRTLMLPWKPAGAAPQAKQRRFPLFEPHMAAGV